MQKEELETLYESLKQDPYTFFLFKKIYVDNSDVDLPNFMDRGNLITILNHLNLVQNSKNQKNAHQHYRPIHLTELGKELGNFLQDKGIFLKFDNISIRSRKEFDESFKDQFLKTEEYNQDYNQDELLSQLYLPKIGEQRIQQGIELKILGFKRCDDLNFFIYEFRIQIICKRCRETFEFVQKIEYIEGVFQPIDFFHKCPSCNLILRCSSYFNQFEMYSEE